MGSRSERPRRRGCGRRMRCIQPLESRTLLAAHIAGDVNVYATIQSAVDAASPGAIITVDAGVYPELVSIFKTLTLRGARASVDGRSNVRSDAAGESVVSGQVFNDSSHSSAFYLHANDVTLDGFTVQDNNSGTYGAGIVIAPGESGTRIVNNVVQGNKTGLYLANASSTDAGVIQHNLFKLNTRAGVNQGRAIYSDGGVSGGSLTNVLIDGNTFFRNKDDLNIQPAIGLESATVGSQSNITITAN